jgi:hypothetical protein
LDLAALPLEQFESLFSAGDQLRDNAGTFVNCEGAVLLLYAWQGKRAVE